MVCFPDIDFKRVVICKTLYIKYLLLIKINMTAFQKFEFLFIIFIGKIKLYTTINSGNKTLLYFYSLNRLLFYASICIFCQINKSMWFKRQMQTHKRTIPF